MVKHVHNRCYFHLKHLYTPIIHETSIKFPRALIMHLHVLFHARTRTHTHNVYYWTINSCLTRQSHATSRIQ